MATFPFNFQARFADAVRSGAKRQTIRRNRRDGRRPVPGDAAKLYTGLRTRATQLLCQAAVTEVLSVRIDFEDRQIYVDGERLTVSERTAFAQADGFASWPDMLTWFAEQYGSCSENRVFEGFCVRWISP